MNSSRLLIKNIFTQNKQNIKEKNKSNEGNNIIKNIVNFVKDSYQTHTTHTHSVLTSNTMLLTSMNILKMNFPDPSATWYKWTYNKNRKRTKLVLQCHQSELTDQNTNTTKLPMLVFGVVMFLGNMVSICLYALLPRRLTLT